MAKIRNLNHCKFSKREIDAARQLIQLSSGDSEEDGSSNDSYSVEQSSNVNGSGSDVVTSIEEADDEEGLGLGRRRNKRYRYVEDLYNVTKPLPVVNPKKSRGRRSVY